MMIRVIILACSLVLTYALRQKQYGGMNLGRGRGESGWLSGFGGMMGGLGTMDRFVGIGADRGIHGGQDIYGQNRNMDTKYGSINNIYGQKQNGQHYESMQTLYGQGNAGGQTGGQQTLYGQGDFGQQFGIQLTPYGQGNVERQTHGQKTLYGKDNGGRQQYGGLQTLYGHGHVGQQFGGQQSLFTNRGDRYGDNQNSFSQGVIMGDLGMLDGSYNYGIGGGLGRFGDTGAVGGRTMFQRSY